MSLFFIFKVLLSLGHAASKVTTDVLSMGNWLGYIGRFQGMWSLRPKGAEEMEPNMGQQKKKKGGVQK